MTETDLQRERIGPDADQLRQSLGVEGARKLATVTKTVPQMRGISPRWLLRMLPWVEVPSGTYRVNRRLSYAIGDGRVTCVHIGQSISIVPGDLGGLPGLRGFDDQDVFAALAGAFEQQEIAPGESIVAAGQAADQVIVIARGKADKLTPGRYGRVSRLAVLADGDCIGDLSAIDAQRTWAWSVRARTACTVLSLRHRIIEELTGKSSSLQAHMERVRAESRRPRNKHGEAAIDIASGHRGEAELPVTFADYEPSPREYELSVAQTILRVHTRVADLYNNPMQQTEQQLRLTIEALRERQEHDLINNREFGLLHNVAPKQIVHTCGGPPTPADLDEVLSRRRRSRFFLAHPRMIAAFGKQCTRRGIYPGTTHVEGTPVMAWRGVPILPCNKLPITREQTSPILVMRTGEEHAGVVALHQTGISDEYRPGLSVRFLGINEKAVISYLVSTYFSTAVLVPDALGMIDDAQIDC